MKALLKKVSGILAVPVLALALSLAAPAVVLAQETVDCTDAASGGIGRGAECAAPTGAADQLFGDGSIFNTVTNILLFVIGAIAVIMLIIGGIRYVVSQGDQNAITSAKNTILYSLIGIAVAFMAFALVTFVTDQLERSGTTDETSYVAGRLA